MNVQVLSITTDISRYGGAQKVMVDVHFGLKNHLKNIKILGFQKFDRIHNKYGISKEEYIKFKNIFYLQDKIVIVHARNVMFFLYVIKRIFCLNTKFIYVSHNVYNTYKIFKFYPNIIVSISNNVTLNLIHFFNFKPKSIRLIYNGINDVYQDNGNFFFKKDKKIKILYSARVNSIKRQILIVRKLKDNIDSNIEIHFAGVGEDFGILSELCKDSLNFKALGFVNNLYEILPKYDFLMLYSIQEGLPISLIEGIMFSKPLLINDVGGNMEIGIPEYNAIKLLNNWDELVNQINCLNNIDDSHYKYMADNSRQLYLQKFQFNDMIKKYLDLLNEI